MTMKNKVNWIEKEVHQHDHTKKISKQTRVPHKKSYQF